jgi:hypothetical protein
MVAVADRGLRHLRDQGLRVAQQQVQHRAGAVELVFHLLRAQAKAVACALHHGTAGGRFAAHEQRHADHAFAADDGDLCRRSVFHDVEQRDDGRGREVDVAECVAGFIEHLAERELDRLELRLPALPLGIRQCGQQLVVSGVGQTRHQHWPRRIGKG